MLNSDHIRQALLAHQQQAPEEAPTVRRSDRSRRIHLLREKINDDNYLEGALEKLAADLARAFY